MITKELMDRFLKNECTADEKKLVNNFLDQHPEELDRYLPAEECREMAPGERVHPAISARMLRRVRRSTYRPFPLRKVAGWSAAAAAVILLMIAVRQLTIPHRPPATAATGDVKEAPAERWNRQFNNTGTVMALGLPDGSTAELQPNSGIRYREPFADSGARAIYVSGEALFKVAKDAARPFMVYSGDIATKVLGTSFTVNAFESNPFIKVRLYTGRVAVTAAGKREMQLQPGQELVYDKKNTMMTVSAFAGKKKPSGIAEEDAKPDWYQFNGQSLPQVLDQLEGYYHVEIDYRPADMLNMYFAGRFDRSDSLEKILNDIALLNGLSVKQQAGRFVIRKHPRS